jgi:hypothetical protein
MALNFPEPCIVCGGRFGQLVEQRGKSALPGPENFSGGVLSIFSASPKHRVSWLLQPVILSRISVLAL